MNESDSPDCSKLGLNVPPHCTVKELYPLISSTVLALEDTDTLNVGTENEIPKIILMLALF